MTEYGVQGRTKKGEDRFLAVLLILEALYFHFLVWGPSKLYISIYFISKNCDLEPGVERIGKDKGLCTSLRI